MNIENVENFYQNYQPNAENIEKNNEPNKPEKNMKKKEPDYQIKEVKISITLVVGVSLSAIFLVYWLLSSAGNVSIIKSGVYSNSTISRLKSKYEYNKRDVDKLSNNLDSFRNKLPDYLKVQATNLYDDFITQKGVWNNYMNMLEKGSISDINNFERAVEDVLEKIKDIEKEYETLKLKR